MNLGTQKRVNKSAWRETTGRYPQRAKSQTEDGQRETQPKDQTAKTVKPKEERTEKAAMGKHREGDTERARKKDREGAERWTMHRTGGRPAKGRKRQRAKKQHTGAKGEKRNERTHRGSGRMSRTGEESQKNEGREANEG